MVLAVISTAFDTVHNAPKTELFSLGFSKNFLRWLTCYLSNRSHWVHIDDQMSKIKQTCILLFSQGSVLGPMLFNLYVSDIYKIAFQIQLQWLFSMQMTPTFIKAAVLLILLNPQRVWTLFLKLQARGLPSHIWRSTPTKTKSMLLSTSRMARSCSPLTWD